MAIGARLFAAVIAAHLFLVATERSQAGGEWPDGPHKEWFQSLERPDNDKNPYRDLKSRSCCGAADVVKTRFRVESGDEKYPEDRWFAWVNEQWIPIPPEKIVKDHAPNGQPYLFMLAGTVQCFVRPKDGT
jgi:hypothetical protein